MTSAVPAEPVKPEIKARRAYRGGGYSLLWGSAEGMMNAKRFLLRSSSRKAKRGEDGEGAELV